MFVIEFLEEFQWVPTIFAVNFFPNLNYTRTLE
jgi:hypothetical protein